MVELALLGPFEARLNGRPVSLRPKQRALLAVLALRAGETVTVDRLIDDLWGERPPATATASLQNAVSLARRALGEGVLVTRGGGYALELERDQVDALRFEQLLAEAQAAHGEERAGTLRRALALWRGPALGDLAFEPFAASEMPRLDELRLSAREQLAEVELGLGRHEAVLGELAALVESSPFRERPRALLMVALYRSGRQAEALEAFQTTRRVLQEELGLEPSPALRTLQQAMLRQDPALDPPDAAPLAHIVGEERRKTVTVVFCDIVGSTALAATLDPEAYRAVLRRYYRAAREVLERHGGTVEKFVGDAVVAVFGVPASHEDDALRAVRAVVELRERVAGLNSELEQAHGVTLRTRIGVNTGEAIAGEPESGQSFATGYAVNVAAKLQQAAPADGILLGAATYRLVRDAVTAEAVEPLRLGGAATPIPAFRVARVDPDAPGVARNLEALLVGRTDELAALRAAFDEARSAGACRVAAVLGEAGIGKSRLAAELSALVADEATVLIGRCVSYGEGATYLPVAEVVRRLVPDGSEAGIAALLPNDADARLVARRLRELLGWAEGAPPPGEAFWAVRRLLEALARARPLLLVLEDVHWAEPTLLDLVDHIAEQASAPLLVLCLSRPDLLDSRPSWEPRVVVRLGPLSDDESAALVDNLARVPNETRARIVEIAEGNALFVEQLHAYAVEAGDAALGAVPPTVDALLASRLDRLPETERSVLERAAVVGREFWRGAVDELSERSARAELEALLGKGLLRAARSPLESEEALAFHHVLIRDVAYAGITKERRSKLHERVAGWIDAREPGWDELVGYHLEQAHLLRAELGPVDDASARIGHAAGERLARAGMRGLKRADMRAAVNLLGRAARLLPDDAGRAEVLCELGGGLRSVGRNDDARRTLAEAAEVGTRAGARAKALRAELELLNLGLMDDQATDAQALVDLAGRAIPLLEEDGDHRSLGRAWILLGDTQGGFFGRNRVWAEAAQHALEHYRLSGWPPLVCFLKLAAAWYNGPTPVVDALRRCESLLEAPDLDRYGEAGVRLVMGGLYGMRWRFDDGRRLIDDARATYEELGHAAAVTGACGSIRARLETLAGEHEDAERFYRETYAQYTSAGELSHAATQAARLGGLLYALDRLDEAEEFVDIARVTTPRDDVLSQALWRSTLAKIHARRSRMSEGELLAREAVVLADATDALDARGHAWADLAEYLHLAEQADEAARATQEAVKLFRRKGNLVALKQLQGRAAVTVR